MKRIFQVSVCRGALCLTMLAAIAPPRASESQAPRTLPLRTQAVEPMPLGVFDCAASLAGGWLVVTGGFAADLSATPVVQVRHATRGWRPIGTQLAHPRARHTQTTLGDGRVLIVGGVQGTLGSDTGNVLQPLTTAEVLHPLMAGSTVIELSEALEGHSAHRLPDGRVAVVGAGWVRIFDPGADSFSEAIRLMRPRRHHAAVLWLRPDPSPNLAADKEEERRNDEADVRIIEQELSIDLVPTARGASIGATLEPQRVEVPRAPVVEAPSAPRLVLLIIGGDDESSIEEIDLEHRRSSLWGAMLPAALSEASAIVCRDGRVLVAGGMDRGKGRSVGSTWWLTPDQQITPGPDLDLPEGVAGACLFVDPRDSGVTMLGGEQRSPDRLVSLGDGRLLRAGGRLLFALSMPAPATHFARRCWVRYDDRRVAAVGGYRYVHEAEDAARLGLKPGVNVRDQVDLILLPSLLGGD